MCAIQDETGVFDWPCPCSHINTIADGTLERRATELKLLLVFKGVGYEPHLETWCVCVDLT